MPAFCCPPVAGKWSLPAGEDDDIEVDRKINNALNEAVATYGPHVEEASQQYRARMADLLASLQQLAGLDG